jgi:hypothetical protein
MTEDVLTINGRRYVAEDTLVYPDKMIVQREMIQNILTILSDLYEQETDRSIDCKDNNYFATQAICDGGRLIIEEIVEKLSYQDFGEVIDSDINNVLTELQCYRHKG